MAQAFRDHINCPVQTALSFEERFGLSADRPPTDNDNWRMDRNLDRAFIMLLAQNRWVQHRHDIPITGPTSVGKSYLASALAPKNYPRRAREHWTKGCRGCCRRSPSPGSTEWYPQLMASLITCKVYLRLSTSMSLEDRRELLEIVEECYRRAPIITSQQTVKSWHDAMQDRAA
ncbi:ATP-binding protein [Geomonas nitrogeniifigens]|uniref:ATP-binding protein n=1 Tax=Geomonas diazotrophica TaxID=2843197 RepID=A0ABX8JH11_9BACT|nr:ATP-binding protein [Geomonas nitrogeniifigens]